MDLDTCQPQYPRTQEYKGF